VLSSWTLAALAVGLFAAMQDVDLFGVIPRAVVIGWFGLLMVAPVVGNVWGVVAPDRFARWLLARPARATDAADSALAAAWALGMFWYLLAFDQPASTHAVVWLLGAVAVTVVATVGLRRPDPLTVFFDALHPTALRSTASNPTALHSTASMPWRELLRIVAVGGLVFAVVRDQTWWATAVGSQEGWAGVARWTAGLVACMAGVAAIAVATIGIVRIVEGGRHAFTDLAAMFSVALLPLVVSLAVVEMFTVTLTALQENLSVMWDPFGRGWSSKQGIDVQLTGAWDRHVRTVVLLLGAPMTIASLFVAAKRGGTTVASAVMPSVVVAVAGLLLLRSVTGA
jgi:hypothetical protein